MPIAKARPAKIHQNGPAAVPPEVLTLAETAGYLRLTEPDVLSLVKTQGLPGRQTGQDWRFLKSAIQDWLRMPLSKPSKQALASVIGTWKDDPELEQMLQEIYRRRGRPMTGEGK